MVTKEERVHFRCPSCGHQAARALKVRDAERKGFYLCTQCGSQSKPEGYFLRTLLYTFGIGMLGVGIMFGVDKLARPVLGSSLFAPLLAIALVSALALVLRPVATRWLWRWIADDRPPKQQGGGDEAGLGGSGVAR